MKSSVDRIAPSDTSADQVELVMLHAGRIAAGDVATDTLTFPDVASAVRHARTLSDEQRAAAWIRCGDDVRTLDNDDTENTHTDGATK